MIIPEKHTEFLFYHLTREVRHIKSFKNQHVPSPFLLTRKKKPLKKKKEQPNKPTRIVTYFLCM